MNDFILLAYSLNGKGGGVALTADALSKRLNEQALTWVHLDARRPESRTWLEKEISHIDPYVVDALLAEEARSRMTQVDEGILLILREVNLNEDELPENMVSIRLWVDKNRIISCQKQNLEVAGAIETKLKIGKGPKDSGQFICTLTEQLLERMELVLTELDEMSDDIEENVLEKADSALRETIVRLRKKAILFRHHTAPQRDAIDHLRMSNLAWLDEMHRRHLQETYNHVTRYVEDLDSIRERAQIVKDELVNMLSDKLNKNMYALSIVAAIFLPLGFLTGLLGINIGGIPGAQDDSAFWVFIGMLFVLVFIQVLIFKRLKWI